MIAWLAQHDLCAVFHYMPLHCGAAGLKYGRFAGEDGYETVLKMLQTGTNCPESSGMGRLFDGVAAILGIRRKAG